MSAESYLLPPSLDVVAAAPLRTDLLMLRGKPLNVDASSVERAGTLGLQVVMAAAKLWASDGVPFAVINSSSQFQEATRLVGATTLDRA